MTSGSNPALSEDEKYTSQNYVNETSVMAAIETTIQPKEDCTGLEAAIHVRLLIQILVFIFTRISNELC